MLKPVWLLLFLQLQHAFSQVVQRRGPRGRRLGRPQHEFGEPDVHVALQHVAYASHADGDERRWIEARSTLGDARRLSGGNALSGVGHADAEVLGVDTPTSLV